MFQGSAFGECSHRVTSGDPRQRSESTQTQRYRIGCSGCSVRVYNSCKMDRFRKCVQSFRVKWREFVRQNWNNDSNGDQFRSLNSLAVLGAMRFNPKTQWQQYCWQLYRITLGLSYLAMFLTCLEDVMGKFEFQSTAWHMTIFGSMSVVFLKELIIHSYSESIQTVQDYLNSKPMNSGDEDYDSQRRKKLFRKFQLTILASHLMWILDLAIMMAPNSGADKVFAIAQITYRLWPKLANLIHTCFIITLSPTWFCKYFNCTGLTCALLSACKMELGIFVRGFKNILDDVQLDVQKNMPPSTSVETEVQKTQRLAQQDELYWKYLKLNVVNQAKQHVQLQENIQLLQPVVRWLYGVIYYNAFIIIGLLIYVIFLSRFSSLSMSLGTGCVLILFECYWWSSVVESLQDEKETLEEEIFDLMTKIPYDQKYHKEYVEMRTMLFIMVINVRNSAQFDCAGVFPISVESFGELVDMAYSLVTFMLNFGRRAYY